MIVTRFAPSPTGLLHMGHAFAAITAHDMGERFLVRIEDIDTSRCREEFVMAIFEDLRWLGLDWEEPVLRQSHRAAAYRAALAALDGDGAGLSVLLHAQGHRRRDRARKRSAAWF